MVSRGTRISLAVIAWALVLIALTQLWNSVGVAMSVATFATTRHTVERDVEVQAEPVVAETVIHLKGEAGETKNFTLRPGVYEFLGASDEAPITITSYNSAAGASWTSFMNVLTIVDPDEWPKAREYDGTFPGGPLRLEVRGDEAWSIDILRRWCPNEIT